MVASFNAFQIDLLRFVLSELEGSWTIAMDAASRPCYWYENPQPEITHYHVQVS